MRRIGGGSVVGEYPWSFVLVGRGAYVQDERYFAIERRDARCEASQSRTAQRSTRRKYFPVGSAKTSLFLKVSETATRIPAGRCGFFSFAHDSAIAARRR
jgi:hypothetical protein